MPQISIIVPVYNAENFLPQCIESLLSQSFKEFEIILVNDGSTDTSLDICNNYAKLDTRIIILSKENEGLAQARRSGIMKASADYITFIDSDDFYEPDYCEKMYYYIKKSDADLVECDYFILSEDTKREHRIYSSDMELGVDKFHEKVVRKTIVNGSEACVVWNKMYRKGYILSAVKDFGDSPLEDYVFNAQYYTMTKRYVYIHQCLTNYRQVPMSLSRKCNLQTFEILKRSESIKVDCLEKMGLVLHSDQSESAEWFVNYTKSFLMQFLLTNNANSDDFLFQVLMDDLLRQECAQITQDNEFACLITSGQIKKATSLLKKNAWLTKGKIKIVRIIKRVFNQCNHVIDITPIGREKNAG